MFRRQSLQCLPPSIAEYLPTGHSVHVSGQDVESSNTRPGTHATHLPTLSFACHHLVERYPAFHASSSSTKFCRSHLSPVKQDCKHVLSFVSYRKRLLEHPQRTCPGTYVLVWVFECVCSSVSVVRTPPDVMFCLVSGRQYTVEKSLITSALPNLFPPLNSQHASMGLIPALEYSKLSRNFA